MAERDGGGDFVDVLAARSARPAEDLLDFIRLPRMHAATFTLDWLEDKSSRGPEHAVEWEKTPCTKCHAPYMWPDKFIQSEIDYP